MKRVHVEGAEYYVSVSGGPSPISPPSTQITVRAVDNLAASWRVRVAKNVYEQVSRRGDEALVRFVIQRQG